MARRALALLLIAGLTASGCATAAEIRRAPAPVPQFQTSAVQPSATGRTQTDAVLLAEYVQKLPIGSRVRVHLADGRRQRGTLMDATAERIVLQPRTRIPEPPVRITLDRIVAVELESPNGSVGRAIGIGIAAGAGAILGVLLLFAAIYSD